MATIGSDVELAVCNEHGVPVDVTGMLGGDKDNPIWFDHFNVQEDNVNAEYAINPVTSQDEWVKYHNMAIDKIKSMLPEGHYVLCNASTEYSDEHLSSENAKKFGCDPDFSAWTGMPNRSPKAESVGNLRTCGGHVHVGLDGIDKEELVKWMDIHLGLPSLFLDLDKKSRGVYGRAGSYRPKPYGIEYRSLSNFWVGSDRHMKWVYDQTMKAVDSMLNVDLYDIPCLYSIPKAIDSFDLFAADSALNWLQKEGIA